MIAESQNEVSLLEVIDKAKNWFNYLLSKWLIIVSLSTLGGGLGFVVAYKAQFMYTATLSFVVEDDKSTNGLGGALGLASQFGIDLGSGSGGTVFAGSNLLELMKSKSLIKKTLLSEVNFQNKKQALIDIYIDYTNSRNKWTNNGEAIPYFTGRNVTMTILQDSIINEVYKSILKSSLTIAPRDKKLGIIDVKFKSTNAFFAKEFVEKLVEVVSDFYLRTKTAKTVSNIAILQRQTDSVRLQLNNAIQGVVSVTDATYNLNPALTISRLPSQKRQIDIQANTAILTELVKNLELAKISLRKETPLIQVIDTPEYPLDKEKLSKKKGIIIGFVMSSFLTIMGLIVRRIWKTIFI